MSAILADTSQNDFPQLKYALLGTVGAFLLLNRDHSS